MKYPLITVIVPIFNVEKYIGKCVDSIFAQTYPNIQVLLINDGSTDASREIIKKYEGRVNCLIVDKENSGQSDCRLIGYEKSKGEFLYFMDSDDTLERNALEIMFFAITKFDADFCCCRYRIVSEDGKLLKQDRPFKQELIIGNENIYRSGQIKSALWVKLFRKSFLERNGIKPLSQVKLHDDAALTGICKIYAEKVCFVNDVLYNVLERGNSISRVIKPLMMTVNDQIDKIKKEELIKAGKYEKYEDQFYLSYAKAITYKLALVSTRCANKRQFLELYRLIPKDGIYYQRNLIPFIFKHSKKYWALLKLSKYPSLYYYLVKLFSSQFKH